MSQLLVDPAAERACLAGISRYNYNAFIDISPYLQTNYFTLDANKALYSVFERIFENNPDAKIDVPIVISTANELGLKDIIEEDRLYIEKILNFVVSEANLVELAKKVQRLAIARQLHYEVLPDIDDNLVKVTGAESLSEIVGVAESRIIDFSNNLSANKNEGIIRITDGIDEWVEYVESNPVDVLGLPIGMPIYDRLTGGIRRKSVSIIAARPGQGKSLLACKAGLNITYKHKFPILYLDSEMNKESHWSRILAIISGATITEVETGKYVHNEMKRNKVRKAIEMLKKMQFYYINIANCSFEEIMSYARRWVLKDVGRTGGVTNECLMIYDYFKLMDDNDLNKMSETQRIGFQLMAVNDFAIKYDIGVLAFAQLGRGGDIADSDRILRYASSVAIVSPKSQEEIAETGPMAGNKKLVITKARYGMDNENDYINIHHERETGRFTEGMLRSHILAENNKENVNEPESESTGDTE